MKNNMKKILSFALAALLILSMFSISALAQEDNSTTNFVGYHSSRVHHVNLADIPNIKTYDLNDLNYEEKPAYKVTDAEGLVYLSKIVSSFFPLTGITVYLERDLDMSEVTEWIPIGSTSTLYFGGTFDGQGHVIDNLIVNDIREGHNSDGFVWTGLFGYVLAGTIKNVVVGEHCSFAYAGTAATPHVAALVAGIGNDPNLGASTIENCLAQGTVTGQRFSGGIVARVQGGTNASRNVCINCTSAVDITCAGAIGGFGAFVQRPYDITNCRNIGDITNTNRSDVSAATGAFVGRDNWNAGGVHISNCINNGNITGKNYVAIFVGQVNNSTAANTTVVDSINYGTYTVAESGTNCALVVSVYSGGATDEVATANVEGKQNEEDPTLANMEVITPDFTTPSEPDTSTDPTAPTDPDTSTGTTTDPDTSDTSADTNETKPQETEPTTEAPASTDSSEEKKSGCSSAITGCVLTILGTVMCAGVFLFKKKD